MNTISLYQIITDAVTSTKDRATESTAICTGKHDPTKQLYENWISVSHRGRKGRSGVQGTSTRDIQTLVAVSEVSIPGVTEINSVGCRYSVARVRDDPS